MIPDEVEANKIAAFLDRTTSQLDDLIAQKQRLIELLKEKRQALITQAVTKGLNPKAKMKDSGVEWLGQIPEHWEVKKAKYIARKIGSGKTPRGGAEVYATSGVIFLRSQNVYDEGLSLDDVAYIDSRVDEEMKSTRVEPGDVLLNITGASIGRTCIWPIGSKTHANVNQHVCIVRCNDIEEANHVSLFLKSTAVKAQIDVLQEGGNREGLSAESTGNLLLAMPPLEEQRRIFVWVENMTRITDAVMKNLENQSRVLTEYRSSLISAAVTGKIDLRNWKTA